MLWTAQRPFGVGTTREVAIFRLWTSRERYCRWDQGRRKTCTAVEVSVPGLRRLAEDGLVDRTQGRSHFVWTVVLEPVATLKPIARLAIPVTGKVLQHVARGIRSHRQ